MNAKKASHLSTLIHRIMLMEERDETDDSVFSGRLMNLAEYMVYNNDWSQEEGSIAREMLNKHKFQVDLTPQGVEAKYVEVRGLPNMYSETCCRCGRPLTNKYSKKKGLGPVCRRKVKQGDWGKQQNQVMEKIFAGKQKIGK